MVRHSPVQHPSTGYWPCPGWWKLAEEGGQEAQGVTAVSLAMSCAGNAWQRMARRVR